MKKLIPWLIIGLVLRLVLMATTVHPDFRAVNFAGYLITQKGELLTFYDHISKLPRNDSLVKLYGDDLFIYPPLAYLSHAIFHGLLSPLYPAGTFDTLINDIGQLRNIPGYQILLILLKTPYLIADIVCLYLLRKLVPEKKKFVISLLWIFNPVNLYVSYMIGQFDIFICVFLLASLVYKKLSPILIGIAAGFKPFPLFLLPVMAGSKIKNIALGLVTYAVIITPYVGSTAFKQYALFATLSDKLVFAKIMVSGSQYLSLFFVVLILLYWWNMHKSSAFNQNGWYAGVLLLFYSVTHFHPQWFVWVAPLLLISMAEVKKSYLPVLVLMLCYAVIVLSFESSLNTGLFGLDISIFNLINHFYPADQFISLTRSVLAATAFAYMWQLHDKKQPDLA